MKKDDDFELILETHSPSDCAFLRSILDAEGVTYFIQGEHVSAYIYHALPMRLMVHRDQADLVRELLKDFDSSGLYDNLK
jgi:hypothetical protein